MDIPGNILSTLSDEMKQKAEAAASPEELLSLVKESGLELPPDLLESVSGGVQWSCPQNCRDAGEPVA